MAQNCLEITITNISPVKGQLLLAIYDSEDTFYDKEKVVKSKVCKINADTETIQIKDLPKGEYAIAVIHDENNDNSLNTNWIGIPTEGMGVSNNPTSYFGPPDYEDAKFMYNGGNQKISITLKYL